MNKTKIAKAIASLIVGIGTSKIVSGIIENNTSPEKVTDKVAIAAAGGVIGTMTAERTKAYTDAKIDEIVARWNGQPIDKPTDK